MTLILHNTLTKKREEFTPTSDVVGLYTCGPTVYHFAHIGNLRSFIFEDVLKRVLFLNNYKVNHVMNITDVGHLSSDGDTGEDKMSKGLKREGLPVSLEGMKQLAQKYTDAFLEDLNRLHIILPDTLCKATEHISEQVAMVQKLEEKGYTYVTSDGVYFDTSKCEDYGKLIGYVEDEGKARIEKNSEKKSNKDFALWKFNSEMGWDTPWGKGFPGWHIECSAMASKYLGQQFDIHCGGQDLAQIHHTNEIAQAECSFGKKPWVKYWLHNEFVVLQKGEKMSKSAGNFMTLPSLIQEGFDPLDFRYLCLGTHYRNPLAFSKEALDSARIARTKLFDVALKLKESEHGKDDSKRREEWLARFTEDVNEDLNTTKGLATMWEMLKSDLHDHDKWFLLLEFDRVFGFNVGEVEKPWASGEVIELADRRLKARKNKDWEQSDKLRDQINGLGWDIADTKGGYELKKK